MIQRVRDSFIAKIVSLGLIPSMILPMIPTASAVNSGPVDANFQGGGGGEMINVSSGDFNYSIPLLDIGGYPITLSYSGEVTMNQQASMVGLGWNLSTGAINRMVRGLPDDFAGDEIETTMNLRPRLTITNSISANSELIGLNVGGGLTTDFSFTFSNYTGNENSIGIGLSAGYIGDGPNGFLAGGLSSSSRSGLSSNLGVSMAYGKSKQFSTSLGINRNSLYGSSLNFNFGFAFQTINILNSSINLSGSYPLSMQSYTPTATFEFENKTWTFDLGAGGTVFSNVDIHGTGTRTKTTICLKENVRKQKAYGYLHQESGYHKNALQDFNLNLPQVHENISGINTPTPTNDYFMVANSGDMFRAIRNDAGYVKDPATKSNGNANALGGDAGIGLLFELGVNYAYSWNNHTTGNWTETNLFSDNNIFKFGTTTPSTDAATKAKYEKFTFQKINNRSSVSKDRYEGVRKNTALRQDIEKANSTIKGHGYMVADDGSPNYDVTNNYHYQHQRRDRNTVFEHLNNYELNLSGDDSFKDFSLNNFSFSNGEYTTFSNRLRGTSNYPSAHIGEFTIVNNGGAREVYGIPVMNESDQVSFNISPINNYSPVKSAPILDSDGLVPYVAGEDNSLENKRGDNHLYLKNHVPKHATSYLLTEVLSNNYVDRSGNGLTPDDYGDYTKFNYAYEGSKKWRFPYQFERATFNEGFKSDPLDDMGSYAYGSRDEWYIHSIESKGYIAEFIYLDRNDAIPSGTENGGQDPNLKAKQLHQIKLYTRKGKEFGEGPIKTVNFVYDYSLCTGIPDNDNGSNTDVNELNDQGGKLTLKQVYFTNHDSPQGILYKYKFSYGNNPSYDLGQTDRWGNFQTGPSISPAVGSLRDNMEYPYTTQNANDVNDHANAWKITAIDMPSGARMEVDYESDDYEYIQNYEATRMYKIDGYYSTDIDTNTPAISDFGSDLFDPDNDDIDNFYILVDLDEAINGTSTDATNIFENRFLPHKTNAIQRFLYYNTLLNLAPHNDGIFDPPAYEYIQGYAEIIENAWYLLESSPGSMQWDKVVYKVKPEKLNETKSSSPLTHPVSRKAWQVIKEALPLVLYPENSLQAIYSKDGNINCGSGTDLEDGGTKPDLGDDSKNHKKNLKSIKSLYHMMQKTGYASRAVDLDYGKSWVRMRPGSSSKYGGGYRVKEVRMYDNWDQFVAGENSSVYGTQYEYTTKNNLGETISSGVASYEPTNSGGDEIAMRYPKFYVHAQKGTPSEKFYKEFPLNENIFDNAQVRYSRVKTKSIEYPGLVMNTTGHTIEEFFTAKDYPFETDYTNYPETITKKPGIVGLTGIKKTRFGISYGSSVQVNDMHGKFKSKTVFTATGNEVYKMEHQYHEESPGVLSSLIPTIKPDGTSEDRLVGVNIDMLTHLNKSESNNSTVGIGTNFEYTPLWFFGFSLWPNFNTSETSVFSTLTTKVIYQTGLLQSIIVEDNGRTKSVKNLLYDAKTGSPIATEITPEKGDGIQRIYEYDYPAYWAYDLMGMASDNCGIRRINITSGAVITAAEKPYFYPGDEVMIFKTSSPLVPIPTAALANHWVIENETNGDYYLADADGVLFSPGSGHYFFKVQNSGKSNEGGTGMASISTLEKHTGPSPYISGYAFNKIVNITGTDYFEDAKLRTDPCTSVGSTINPYSHNLKGIWKSEHAYVFDGDRDYTANDTRKDGLLTDYQPFWQNVNGTWRPIYDPIRTDYNLNDPLQDWIQTSKSGLFDSYGFNLESTNALDVSSSIGTGYNKQLQKSMSVNSTYTESGFDGFEDYLVDGTYDLGTTTFTPYGCHTRLFGFLNAENNLTTEEAHTGRYSLLASMDLGISGNTWDGVTSEHATLQASPYIAQQSQVIPGLSFLTNQAENKYVLTFWLKEDNQSDPTDYPLITPAVYIAGAQVPVTERRSNIIDGWQRREVIFNIPPTTPNNSNIFIAISDNKQWNIYIDDIRIEPYDSEMTAYVVDPIYNRLMATLDNRNFATIYQYDEDGKVVRIIQETERGKQTVKESRSGIKLNN